MKISELIKKLEILKEKHGDNKLRFTVKDYYSIYGEEMSFNLLVGDDLRIPGFWDGMHTNDGTTTLEFHLEQDAEGKKSKITFRK